MTLQEYLDKNYTKEEQSNLTHLYCSNNSITSLEGLEPLKNLTVLSCSNNSITTLKGLEHLKNLKELYCYNNNIKEIDLSHNQKLDMVCLNKNIKLLNLDKWKIEQLRIV